MLSANAAAARHMPCQRLVRQGAVPAYHETITVDPNRITIRSSHVRLRRLGLKSDWTTPAHRAAHASRMTTPNVSEREGNNTALACWNKPTNLASPGGKPPVSRTRSRRRRSSSCCARRSPYGWSVQAPARTSTVSGCRWKSAGACSTSHPWFLTGSIRPTHREPPDTEYQEMRPPPHRDGRFRMLQAGRHGEEPRRADAGKRPATGSPPCRCR